MIKMQRCEKHGICKHNVVTECELCKKDKRFIAYYAATGETETFNTYEEAEYWLIEYDTQDGISEESIAGKNYIAEIVAVSTFVETDNKNNYKNKEEWPYSNEHDKVGYVSYGPINLKKE